MNSIKDKMREILGVDARVLVCDDTPSGVKVHISYEGTNTLSFGRLLDLSEFWQSNDINFSGYSQEVEIGEETIDTEEGFKINIRIDDDVFLEMNEKYSFE